jgi:hypothetical protein
VKGHNVQMDAGGFPTNFIPVKEVK